MLPSEIFQENCQLETIKEVRDLAKQQLDQGDPEAGYVLAWMEQILTQSGH